MDLVTTTEVDSAIVAAWAIAISAELPGKLPHLILSPFLPGRVGENCFGIRYTFKVTEEAGYSSSLYGKIER